MKPFALVFLTTLRVAKFDTKDEWYDAMRTLKQQNTPFIALKYHFGSERYITPERGDDD